MLGNDGRVQPKMEACLGGKYSNSSFGTCKCIYTGEIRLYFII